MISQELFHEVLRNKKVFITGNTGFIGTWLSLWLHHLGAHVIGYSLPPPTNPSLFETLQMDEKITNIQGDVRDYENLIASLSKHKPEILIHLAAQPLVITSYAKPIETMSTNVMGTVNVLEAARNSGTVRVCINFTSDKCYDNHESNHAYNETDPLGGFDPYSASKGASELVSASYRNSFFKNASDVRNIQLASIRAGNVIGGGDWAENRIVPDAIRNLMHMQKICVRHPKAIRPWQHVLEPVSGIIWLATNMWEHPSNFDQAWNFGPNDQPMTVENLVTHIITEWGDGFWNEVPERDHAQHEATLLRLDCRKANNILRWYPVFSTKEAITKTVSWYKAYVTKNINMDNFSEGQIENYIEKANAMNIAWTKD